MEADLELAERNKRAGEGDTTDQRAEVHRHLRESEMSITRRRRRRRSVVVCIGDVNSNCPKIYN